MELAVLIGDELRQKLGDDVPDTVRFFLAGQFEAVLGGNASKQILGQNSQNQQNLEACIVKNVEIYLSAATGEDTTPRHIDVLLTGAACLQLFVQNNWLGPLTTTPPVAFLAEPFSVDKEVQETSLSSLSEDGEPAYNLSCFAGYLYLARVIFLECRNLCTSLQTWDWWLARCLSVQQSLLEQKSPTLRATIFDCLEQISKAETLISDEKNRDIAVLFHVEASRMCQVYWEDKMARDHVTQARKLAGITVELTGALGKRTRFQQEHKAQLILSIIRDEGEQPLPHVGLCDPQFSAAVSKSLPLDDDTVLDKINFKDEESNTVTQLSPIEQALLYALMESHRRAYAQEKLTDEEVMVYLEHIISQVSSWPLSVSALTLRCRMECNSRRRVERAMQQLEEMKNSIGKPDPVAAVRLQLFYAARPLTSWALQKELAALLLSLGCIGPALDIYEHLQLWEDAIACYQRIGKQEKAESLIREQLALKVTPTLLCFLADITRDKTHYQKAWELSNQRSARAMRGLGYVYFAEEEFEEAAECFEKSLAVNSLQIPVWFTCGCAWMAAKKYESAVKAFRRCVTIDYDNFEAWSNLATAHARLKNKRMAFMTLQDAIRCNFENWRLWENFLLFATDCGEFEEVIRAYHRLLDLKGKWTDTEILRIVVKAVVTNLEDAHGNPSARLLPKMLELFGRITAKVTADAEMWQLYGDLCRAETPDHPADLEKAVQFLQKSHRCVMQKSGWEKDQQQCEKVAQQSLDLAQTYQNCVSGMDNTQQALQMLSSAKFMLKGVVSKIKQEHTDPVSKELAVTMNTLCQNLDQELQTVVDKMEQLRSA